MHFLTVFNGAGCFMGAFIVQMTYIGSQGKNVLMLCVSEMSFLILLTIDLEKHVTA